MTSIYSECVLVALFVQHAPYGIALRDLSGSIMLIHIIS